jgi:hypothetical protein
MYKMSMGLSDVAILVKKIIVGVLLVLIPLGIVAGALQMTHRILLRHAAASRTASNAK